MIIPREQILKLIEKNITLFLEIANLPAFHLKKFSLSVMIFTTYISLYQTYLSLLIVCMTTNDNTKHMVHLYERRHMHSFQTNLVYNIQSVKVGLM